MPITPHTIEALAFLRKCLPRAAEDLNMDFGEGFDLWRRTLDRKLLPRLHKDFPLVAAIAVPLLAGLWPVFSGARITVRQAITSYGLGGNFGLNRLDRLIERLADRFFSGEMLAAGSSANKPEP